jgi:(1->4)-alpha-D-glucan 1-alpha-D-glucosylmutase
MVDGYSRGQAELNLCEILRHRLVTGQKGLKDKVLTPVLGGQYGSVLEDQELPVIFEEGSFFAAYYEQKFPLRPQTYVLILEHRLRELESALQADSADLAEFLSIITALRHLPSYTETDPDRIAERYREKEVIKRRLGTLVSESPSVKAHVEKNVELFNGTKGDPKSFDLIDGLMNQQIYRLSHWRVATEEINYRRFFDVNGLGAIRTELPPVFQRPRAYLPPYPGRKRNRPRVDHPDGLFNPVEYFHRVQRGCFVQRMIEAGRRARTGTPEDAEETERELGKATTGQS